MKIYVSGALTGVPNVSELQKLYEAIAQLCTDMGFDVYVPHLKSDPIKHAGLAPEQVYEMDSHNVKTAHLVIAYIGVPSLGVGAELEIAHYEEIPIILLYEAGNKPVSRMARGNPAVKGHVIFVDAEDALNQIKVLLLQFASDK